MQRADGATKVDAERLLDWLSETAEKNGGTLPAFPNADAMASLGKADPERRIILTAHAAKPRT